LRRAAGDHEDDLHQPGEQTHQDAHAAGAPVALYKLTQHFAVDSRTPGFKPDAYFDPKPEDILSPYFLVAARGICPARRCICG
jgi:hypothetical protein